MVRRRRARGPRACLFRRAPGSAAPAPRPRTAPPPRADGPRGSAAPAPRPPGAAPRNSPSQARRPWRPKPPDKAHRGLVVAAPARGLERERRRDLRLARRPLRGRRRRDRGRARHGVQGLVEEGLGALRLAGGREPSATSTHSFARAGFWIGSRLFLVTVEPTVDDPGTGCPATHI